jgi:PAS domain S-box-containing protein
MNNDRTVEERLRVSQWYNRGIIEAFPAAMLVVDPGLGITDVNEEAVSLTGCPRAELVGSPLDAHFSVPEPAMDAMRQTFGAGGVSNFELALKSSAGSERAVPFRAAMFRDPDGERRGVILSTLR